MHFGSIVATLASCGLAAAFFVLVFFATFFNLLCVSESHQCPEPCEYRSRPAPRLLQPPRRESGGGPNAQCPQLTARLRLWKLLSPVQTSSPRARNLDGEFQRVTHVRPGHPARCILSVDNNGGSASRKTHPVAALRALE